MGHDMVGWIKKKSRGTGYIARGLGFLSANGSKGPGFQVQFIVNFALISARDGIFVCLRLEPA